jgi:hypothetical protein
MFKKLSSFKNEFKLISNDVEKLKLFLTKTFTLKRLILFALGSNLITIFYFIPKYNDSNHNISFSRYLSKKIGQVGNIPVPKFMRRSLYRLYMKIYNVNENEILDTNLENYRTIKEFFIRKIDVSKL